MILVVECQGDKPHNLCHTLYFCSERRRESKHRHERAKNKQDGGSEKFQVYELESCGCDTCF